MANSNQHETIKAIENGKYKNKSLYYVLRALEVVGIGVSYGSSFLIPFINASAVAGNMTSAVIGLGALLSRESIDSALQLVQQRLNIKFELSRQEYMTKQKLDLLEKSKGIVTEETTINQEIDGDIVESKQERALKLPEIASKISKYFSTVTDKQDRMPGILTNMGASILAFGGAIITTASSGGNPAQTLLTLATATGVGAASMIYTNKKRKAIRKEGIIADSKSDLYTNELLNTEPINKEDKEFIVNRTVQSVINSNKIWSKMRKTYANVDVLNSAVFGGALASLCLGQLAGITTLTPQSILGITSMVYFYSDIISKVGRSIRSVKDLTEISQDYKQTEAIMQDLSEQIETKKDLLHTVDREFTSIHIKDFEGKFYSRTSSTDEVYKAHRLSVPDLRMEKGETILVSGESGSGKTTLFRMIRDGNINNTGSIALDGEEKIDNIGNASLFYTPTIHLSNSENVLHEITCGKSVGDLSKEERAKLLRICKGLKLDDVSGNSIFQNEMMKTLSQKTYDEFSVGQQQRLVLAKMLYLLNDEHQMLILDEPTANLDKESANQVFEFINQFCNEDRKRIILMCSHQLDIASRHSDRRYDIKNGVLQEVPIERPIYTREKENEPAIAKPEKVHTRVAEPEYYI